jgi:hypothetical protein
MNFNRFALAAIVLLATAPVASAQGAGTSTTAASGATAGTSGVVATVDVSRLPIDLARIEREFRQGDIREVRNGLNLRYFIQVFAKGPNIVLIHPEDNVESGRAPYGGPTHSDMLEVMTPREYRNHGGVNILNPKPATKK